MDPNEEPEEIVPDPEGPGAPISVPPFDAADEGPYGEVDARARKRRLLALLAFILVLGGGAVTWALIAADVFSSAVQGNQDLIDETNVSGLFSRVDDASAVAEIETCRIDEKGLLRAEGTLHIGEDMTKGIYLVQLAAEVEFEGADPLPIPLSDTVSISPGDTENWGTLASIIEEDLVDEVPVQLNRCEVDSVSVQILNSGSATTTR